MPSEVARPRRFLELNMSNRSEQAFEDAIERAKHLGADIQFDMQHCRECGCQTEHYRVGAPLVANGDMPAYRCCNWPECGPVDLIWWGDLAGDALEEEGVDPGHIFEFRERLSPELEAGGLIVSKLPPGVIPTSPLQVEKVVVMHKTNKSVQTSPGGWPLFVTRFHKLSFA